jgi:hypothetical protein
LHPPALWEAYLASWTWGNALMRTLWRRHDLAAPQALLDRLNKRLIDHHHAFSSEEAP